LEAVLEIFTFRGYLLQKPRHLRQSNRYLSVTNMDQIWYTCMGQGTTTFRNFWVQLAQWGQNGGSDDCDNSSSHFGGKTAYHIVNFASANFHQIWLWHM